MENGKPQQNLEVLIKQAEILRLPPKLLWFALPGKNLVFADAQSAAESRDKILVASTGMDTSELVRRLRLSSVDDATIDAMHIMVEQMCCEYSHGDAQELAVKGRRWLTKVTELLSQRLTLKQHQEILNNAGMLALLVGCLEYDLGDQRSAESTRRMAMSLGKESNDPMIMGWAHEMLAWFHLTAGNFRAVIPAAETGILAASSQSVTVQLHGQQAKAYARMGMPNEARAALERGSDLLGTLPYPERPENHFVVDPDKWDFYAMDTYRIAGEDDLAKRNAEEVIRRSVTPNGFNISPMRSTEAELTLAVVAARQGDVEQAAALGIEALLHGRQSRPSLLMVASELDNEFATHGSNAGSDFRELFSGIKRATQINTAGENQQ
ncbi:hypothetical protein [Lentzea albidocapillata]|uniref:hypothetical protein n=1 Tax=Lentzea albidocapillata TaxID=40571 RepID=UPI003B845BF5